MNAGGPAAAVADEPFPYRGPEDLRAPVIAALSRVIDPEVAMTIVDVGLIYGVAVKGDELHVRLTMTSAACPVADVIVDDVWHELSRILPASMAIETELVWEPEWTSDRMSERARNIMGW
jgi:metal-sulfur cluster biosynthetic enzyme